MSDTKHTPGPWIVQDEYEDIIPIDSPPTSNGGYEPIEVCRVSNQDEDGMTANACLIAAAPDLYDALHNLEAGVRLWISRGVSEEELRRAGEALRKAEGK
jgi:hypothetical protein